MKKIRERLTGDNKACLNSALVAGYGMESCSLLHAPCSYAAFALAVGWMDVHTGLAGAPQTITHFRDVRGSWLMRNLPFTGTRKQLLVHGR